MAMNFTLSGTLLSAESDPCARETYDSVDGFGNKAIRQGERFYYPEVALI